MSKSSEQLRQEVFGIDLEPMKFKLMSEKRWSLREADDAESAYKGFLFLAAKYPENVLTPTKIVDEMWHSHILDTAKYANDCTQVFGRFLHHWPYSGMLSADDAASHKANQDSTRDLVIKEFGSQIREPWVKLLAPTTAFNAAAPCQTPGCNASCYGHNDPPSCQPACSAPPSDVTTMRKATDAFGCASEPQCNASCYSTGCDNTVRTVGVRPGRQDVLTLVTKQSSAPAVR